MKKAARFAYALVAGCLALSLVPLQAFSLEDTDPAGSKAMDFYKDDVLIAQFDTFTELQEVLREEGAGDYHTPRTTKYKLVLHKDVVLESYYQFGWPFGELTITSANTDEPRTITSRSTDNRHMFGVVNQARLRLEHVTIDGSNKRSLIWIESGLLDPSAPDPGAVVILGPGSHLTNGLAERTGGAIFMQKYARLIIDGGEISQCRSGNVGGAICSLSYLPIQMTGGSIHDNQAAYGAAFYIQGVEGQVAELTVEGGSIESNQASAKGGAIMLGKSSRAHIEQAVIARNQATAWGGGIYQGATSEIELVDTQVIGNQAKYGGGHALVDDARAQIHSGSYVDNRAEGQGGALYPYGPDAQLTAEDLQIARNEAPFGGGVFNGSPLSRFERVQFEANEARAGGALWLSQPCHLSHSQWRSNHALRGAGICQKIPEGSMQNIEDARFEANHAELYGGGLALEQGGLSLVSAAFINNSAQNEALLSEEDKLLPVEENKRRGSGGGLWLTAQADPITLNNSEFSGNEAYFGGGIWAGGSLVIDHSSFIQNKATVIQDAEPDTLPEGHGGALFVDASLPQDGRVSITASEFVGNEAAKTGGAVSIDETKGFVHISHNSRFENNRAVSPRGGGGALYSNLHAYKPSYNDGTHGDLLTEPVPDDFYTNLETDPTTEFIGNRAAHTYTPPANRAAFTNLRFARTSHPGTRFDHILNNDDVNARSFVTAVFDLNYPEAKAAHAQYLVLEGTSLQETYPDDPERPGFAFLGWSDTPEKSGPLLDRSSIVGRQLHEHTTWYAQWAPRWTLLNAAPHIQAEDRTIFVGDAFDPLEGVQIQDAEDGAILVRSEHLVHNTVDTSRAGVYELRFEVEDSQGARTTKTVSVVVQNRPVPPEPEAPEVPDPETPKTPDPETPEVPDPGLVTPPDPSTPDTPDPLDPDPEGGDSGDTSDPSDPSPKNPDPLLPDAGSGTDTVPSVPSKLTDPEVQGYPTDPLATSHQAVAQDKRKSSKLTSIPALGESYMPLVLVASACVLCALVMRAARSRRVK